MSLGYFIDIQGTLLSDIDKSPIGGSRELLEYLNGKNIPYTLVTNNTKKPSDELMDELHQKGFVFDDERFIDPLMILKDMIKNDSVKPYGSKKFVEVLPQLGLKIDKKNPQAILIASYDKFSSEDFANMIDEVLNGAKLIGMHATSTYVKHKKRYPGVGAILAMIEYATGIKATNIVGKPSEVFYKSALNILKKQNPTLSLSDITMISDDAIGDLVGAKRLDIKTSLVLSGKCKNIEEVGIYKDKMDRVYNSVDEILGELQ